MHPENWALKPTSLNCHFNMQLEDMDAAIKAGRNFGYPLMIKSRKMAYDGRGNAVAHSVDKVAEAVQVLGGFERGLYAEKWAPFEKVKRALVCFSLTLSLQGSDRRGVGFFRGGEDSCLRLIVLFLLRGPVFQGWAPRSRYYIATSFAPHFVHFVCK